MRSLVLFLLIALSFALLPIRSEAATIVVNTDGGLLSPGFADDGQCTLFEAVAAANDNAPSGTQPGECIAGESGAVIDEIVFDAAMLPAEILVEAELIITDGLAINGPHRDLLTLNGLGINRVLQFANIESNDDFTVRDLTITGGKAGGANLTDGSGGAIWAQHGGVSLTIERVRFDNNVALAFGGAIAIQFGVFGTTTIRESIFEGNVTQGTTVVSDGGGGAIYIGGFQQVTVEDSTFVDNFADAVEDDGGSDGGGGAIYILSQSASAVSTLDVFRSTFSANATDGTGGAISVGNPTFFDDRSVVSVRHSTLTLNRADEDDDNPSGSGGGIYSTAQDGVTLFNSLIARNEDQSTDSAPNLAGSFNTLGHNFISNNEGVEGVFPFGIPNANNDFASQPDLDPGLDVLTDNGGPTPTHALLEGALPLDQGRCAQQSVDQRGSWNPDTELRTVDQPDIVDLFAGCDIGAYERDAEPSAQPEPLPDTFSVAEDTVLAVADADGSLTASPDDDGVLVNDTHPAGLPLVVLNPGTITPTTSDMSSGGTLDLFADGTFVYAPPPDESGWVSTASEVSDGRYRHMFVQLSIEVLPVNDGPSFTAASSTINASTAGTQVTVPAWAGDIDPGAPDEAVQVLTFDVSVVDGDPALLATAPTIHPTSGDLSYEIAAGQTGFVLLDVVLVDDGGTDLGGVDASLPAPLTIAFESNPPEVMITSPADGSAFDAGTSIDLAATATDVEDGDLGASIDWQSDLDGALGTGAGLQVDTLTVGRHRIRARVLDSDGLPGRDFIELTVRPEMTPPVVEILEPNDGSSAFEGDPVQFSATADDAENGDVSMTLTWNSNFQGIIGSGAAFSTDQLVPGAHAITAFVVDSDGQAGQDQVSVTVEALSTEVLFADGFEPVPGSSAASR